MVEQKLRVILITGRTIDQGVGKEMGKGSKEYFDSSSICIIDEADLKKLGIKSRTNVKVTSKYGSVIVKAAKNPYGSNPGLVFIPCGLWANAICGDETFGMGMPLYKGFAVEVEPAPNEVVLTLDELLKKEYGR
ncbi:MAG TPA: molybdopterin dinucleotide binding domain-containing protein [Candidatus Acidoferrales bacterium]|nr:molybdopterin dinucleotide binding domain-containing protein [Candidatus Acidoferrales bacterium]